MPHGLGLGRAHGVAAVAQGLGHGVDHIVRQRGDKGDDHHAHDQARRQGGLGHRILIAQHHRDLTQEGPHGQKREETVDHSGHARENLERRLGPGAQARARVLRQIDRRHQADGGSHQHGDQGDQGRAGEQGHRAEGAGLAHLVGANGDLRAPVQPEQEFMNAPVDRGEEADRFKQEREHDPQRGEDGDGRGHHQGQPDHALHPVARPEPGANAGAGEGEAADREGEGDACRAPAEQVFPGAQGQGGRADFLGVAAGEPFIEGERAGVRDEQLAPFAGRAPVFETGPGADPGDSVRRTGRHRDGDAIATRLAFSGDFIALGGQGSERAQIALGVAAFAFRAEHLVPGGQGFRLDLKRLLSQRLVFGIPRQLRLVFPDQRRRLTLELAQGQRVDEAGAEQAVQGQQDEGRQAGPERQIIPVIIGQGVQPGRTTIGRRDSAAPTDQKSDRCQHQKGEDSEKRGLHETTWSGS